MLSILPVAGGQLNRRFASWTAVVAWLFVIDCGGPTEPAGETVLRVSVPYGLTSLRDLNQPIGGSSANILDLMLDPLSDHAEVVRRDGRTVYLRPRAGEPLSPVELAGALREPGLISTAIDDRGQIVAEFREPGEAAYLDNPNERAFALGPYELEDENLEAGWVRLRARRGAAIDVIEFIAVDASEQWRRLHARNVDVVPMSPELSREAYAGMASVRTLDYPVLTQTGITFNVQRPALAAADVRRRLAAAIDRRAVAAIACGTADCAIAAPVAPVGDDVPLPEALELMALDSDSVGIDVGRAVRVQLQEAGVNASLLIVDLEQMFERLLAGRFDAVLGQTYPVRLALRLLRRDAPNNIGKWSHPEFEAAADRGDLDAAARILAAELPQLPLIEDRMFAAVDARFCGGVPTERWWRFLADLYPCDQGESP